MANTLESSSGQNGNDRHDQPRSSAIDWQSALTKHRSWLRTVIRARVGEPQAVDEVLQEVGMAAIKSAPADLPEERAGAWLYQVAVRKTLMYRRTAGRRRGLVDRYAEKLQPRESDSREASPLEWMIAEENATKIQNAMAGLHRRDREILLLKYEQSWSYREIVDHLGISQSAVEARLYRARNRLREALVKSDVYVM